MMKNENPFERAAEIAIAALIITALWGLIVVQMIDIAR
jgi:hypothetical protein